MHTHTHTHTRHTTEVLTPWINANTSICTAPPMCRVKYADCTTATYGSPSLIVQLPPGRAPGQGGAAGGRPQVPQAPAGSPGGRNKGGGGALSPSPPSTPPPSSSQGLADIFGNISRQLTVARAGVPAPGVGTGRPPGVADSSSGGGQETPTDPHPTGDGSRGAVAATSAARAGQDPSPGAVTGRQGESQPPSPPQKRAQRAGGKRVGQPRHPMQTLCDEHRAPACKSCKGHRGVRHCCSRHHEGHPRVLGGGQRCLPVQGGGGATAASRRVDLRRVGDYASPRDRGGGGRPSRAGDGGVAPQRHSGPR